MQETETLLSIIQKRQLWNEMLESHVPGNSQAWFGEGQLEKGQYMAPRWLPTPLRSGQIRLTESAGLECYMSEAALAPTGDETASPNSGENRPIVNTWQRWRSSFTLSVHDESTFGESCGAIHPSVRGGARWPEDDPAARQPQWDRSDNHARNRSAIGW
jgi:hypothetical protein